MGIGRACELLKAVLFSLVRISQIYLIGSQAKWQPAKLAMGFLAFLKVFDQSRGAACQITRLWDVSFLNPQLGTNLPVLSRE